MEHLVTKLCELYSHQKQDVFVVRSPYRICPLGAHVDHQLGEVTGMSLDHSVTLAFVPNKQKSIRITSMDFHNEMRVDFTDIVSQQAGCWGNYLRGAILALQEKYDLICGFDGVIQGSLPNGGISSSAAVGVAYLLALEKANHLDVTAAENVVFNSYIENCYLGLNNGILDQSMILLGRKDHLLHLDCRTREHRYIASIAAAESYEFILAYSGISASLVSTNYNQHVQECKEAATLLLKASGQEATTSPVLSDISTDVFAKYAGELPEHLQQRARHYFEETKRLHQGVEAWQDGDIERFGRLMVEAGQSSVDNYKCGSPELIALDSILNSLEGVYGARFSGAGYRGCCFGIVNPAYKESIAAEVTKQYLQKFPHLAPGHKVFYCHSDDGAAVT